MIRSRLALLLALGLALGAGCSSPPKPASTLTEAQRDSVLARSDIPGARAVGRAFGVAGIEARHSAQIDSLTNPR